MYNYGQNRKTSIKINQGYEGETIEKKVRRIVNNKEPIKDGAPLVYTERKDGVQPEYDIRTDRFEVAVDAMDKVAKDKLAKREERFKDALDKANKDEKKEIGGEKTDPKVKENKGEAGKSTGGEKKE